MGGSERRGLLSEAQVAAVLRCDAVALQRMRAAGVGPAYLVLPGGLVVYTPSSVRAWVCGRRNYRDRPRSSAAE
jgi:hypothetical protein